LVGFAGIKPTIEGIKRGKRIALANKETLVVAGEIITRFAKQFNSEIIPVDSEHSAIFQCFVGEKEKEAEKIILTASGGPFFKKRKEELESVTVAEALNHPNWNMGSKVTIDSATMMNKGLEMIEARWLFDMPPAKIDVTIHPQSIIHSMVQFVDGSIKAQLSSPDMRLPIQYALTYPERLPNSFTNTKLTEIEELSFFKPDFEKFECLQLAFTVMKTGGTAPCILNAANEIAVERFLKNEISFNSIPKLIKEALNKIEIKPIIDLETIIECDSLTREYFKV
jgi:1-deoxy-D-xylulose-5-phosphate reductoisomerase